jgi:ABC-2 type transport system ATP-binding protein
VAHVQPTDGSGQWLIDSKPEMDAREAIFRLCVDKDWIITQMTPVESSLEDIFRELTVN